MARNIPGPPERSQELDLAEEEPSERAYRFPVDQLEVESTGHTVTIKTRKNLGPAAEYLIVCVSTAGMIIVTVTLCNLSTAPGWVTLLLGIATALVVPYVGFRWTRSN